MKRTLIAAAAALIALTGSAGMAMAQPGDNHDRGGQDQGRGHEQGHDNGHGNGQGRGYGGYVRHDDWRKGHRLAQEDWSRGQRVDYRQHHLRAPPRGYEWREVDGNYVLAAVATGLIYSIIANRH
ncbi:MAG: RcnB family protein [Phenylobacterium sp.]